MRVPYAHYEAASPAAEPIADDGDHRGPAGGLQQARDCLGEDVEHEGVQGEEVPGAEEGDGGAAPDHSGGEEEAEIEAIAEVASAEHAERVEGEERDVGLAEEGGVVEGRPRLGERALHDAGWLAGGVVEGVGEEGEPEDEATVGVVGESGQGAEARRRAVVARPRPRR